MVILKINGKAVPNSWATCSTGIFQEITQWDSDKPVQDKDPIKLYSILTGLSYEKISSSTDKALEAALWESSRFVYEADSDFYRAPVPDVLKFSGKEYTIPKQMGRMTIGQNVQLRQQMRFGKDSSLLLSLAVAVCLQPDIDARAEGGKMVKAPFDFDRALEIEKEIKSMPITEIYPVGFFLLSRLKPFGKGFFWRLLLKIRMKLQNVKCFLSSPTLLSWTKSSRRLSSTGMQKLTEWIQT